MLKPIAPKPPTPSDKRADKPVFVAINPDTGHEFKVWLDGGVEGFPIGYAVFNRIPAAIATAVEEAIQEERSAHDLPGEDN